MHIQRITYRNGYTATYKCTYAYVNTNICLYIHVNKHININIYTYANAYTQSSVYTCKYKDMYIHVQKYMCIKVTHICKTTCKCKYMQIQKPVWTNIQPEIHVVMHYP